MAANLIGKILLDQYRVDAFVASGGMGSVYRVWDLKRNVPLAMKVLHAELAEDPSVFKRFQREARALQKLAHPNIVPFYGLFQTQDFAFLLERFVDGPTLRDVLQQRRGRPLPIDEALVYLKALSAAIGYAHANGVVHCDIKPGNVIIDPGGNVYLTDFGIARHAESATTTVGAAGTPAYMAPEQIRGEPVTPATDVYALGVTLFEMLTGQRPFRGDEAGTESAGSTAGERIRYAQLNLAPPDPRSLNPAISPELAQVVLRALVKQPEGRCQSTQELFAAVCASVGVQAEQVRERVNLPTPVERSYVPPVPVQGPLVATPGKTFPFPVLAVGAGIGLLVLIGIIILVAVLTRDHGSPSIPVFPTSQATEAQTGRVTSTPGILTNPTSHVLMDTPIPSTARPIIPTSDPDLIFTAAAQTIQAQLTEAAIRAPRSPTPTPTPPPRKRTPTPTPSAIIQATPTPYFGSVSFCADPDCSAGSTSVYPKGAKQVFFMFEYHNMRHGTSYGRRWYVNGNLYLDYSCAWGDSWPSDGLFLKRVFDLDNGLAPGKWRIEILVEGHLQATAQFSVKGTTRMEEFLNLSCTDDSPTYP